MMNNEEIELNDVSYDMNDTVQVEGEDMTDEITEEAEFIYNENNNDVDNYDPTI